MRVRISLRAVRSHRQRGVAKRSRHTAHIRAVTGSNPVTTTKFLHNVTAAWLTVNQPVLVRVQMKELFSVDVLGLWCSGQHLCLSHRRGGFDPRQPRSCSRSSADRTRSCDGRGHRCNSYRERFFGIGSCGKVNAPGRAACLENRAAASVAGVRVTRLPLTRTDLRRVNLRGGEFAWKAKRRASAGVRVVRPPFVLIIWKVSVSGRHGSFARRCAPSGVGFKSSAFR